MPLPLRRLPLLLAPLLLISLIGGGCRSAADAAYFRTMEALGKEKRSILVDRVEAARDSQEDAKEQFRDALDAFAAVTGYDGGELEEVYRRVQSAYDESSEEADEVRERIDAVERVSEALFDEWEAELDDYEDRKLRRASERQLEETRDRYEELLAAMRQAEAKMDPVLEAFEDQVLFLKHNLNARAVASLEGTLGDLETDIAQLIREMEASIAEANRFIEGMQAA